MVAIVGETLSRSVYVPSFHFASYIEVHKFNHLCVERKMTNRSFSKIYLRNVEEIGHDELAAAKAYLSHGTSSTNTLAHTLSRFAQSLGQEQMAL